MRVSSRKVDKVIIRGHKMKYIFSIPNIYTLLWLIQIFNSGYGFLSDTISVLELYVLIAWSLYIILKGFFERVFHNLRPLNIFLVLLTIYGMLRIVSNEELYIQGIHRLVNSRFFIISHWTSILPIYVYYYFTAKKQISEEWFKFWSIIFSISAVAIYLAAQQKAILIQNLDPEEFTNNSAYLVLSVIPSLLFWKNNIVKYGLITIILALVILCMKRGAILIGAVMLLMFFIYEISRGSKKSKFVNFVFASVLVVAGIFFIGNLMNTNEYFMHRIEITLEGNSSGRDSLFTHLWDYMTNEANAFEFIFGLGADGTVKAIGQVAHNDWLEYFVDMGVVGLLAFFALWINLFRMYLNYAGNSTYKFIFSMIIIFLFIRTLFSMSLSDISLFLSCVLGFCLYFQSSRSNKI